MDDDEVLPSLDDQDASPSVPESASLPGSGLSMLVEAESVLQSHGYAIVPDSVVDGIQHDRMRVLEDDYGVVLLQCFDSVEALLELWEDAQSILVKALASYVIPGAARGWEGYVVLMTPAHALSRDVPDMMRVRYDTTRTRKIVITGADRVRRGLAPLLPLPDHVTETSTRDPFDFVVDHLEGAGVPSTTSRALLESYRNQRSLFEALESSIQDQLKDAGSGDS